MEEVSTDVRARHLRLVLILVCAAQFMVILDVSIVNVALPSIRTDLHFSATGLQWVVNAYTLTFGGLLMLGGRAGDIFGRKRMFVAGVVVFAGASLLGGLAQDQAMLIAARALQGVGGAIVAPATLSILATTFREGRERTRAFAAWGAVSGAGGSAGAIAGGVLTDLLNWRWILFVNVPIGALLVLRSLRDLPADPPTEHVRVRDLDLGGAATVTLGVVAIVFGIVRTESVGWGSVQTIVALALGVVLLATFVVTETKLVRRPLIPLSILRSRELRAANVAMLMLYAALFALWYFLSLFYREVLGYSAIEAGLAFLPMTFLFAICSTQASKVVARFGTRPTLIGAFVLSAIGAFWYSRMDVHTTFLGGILPPSIIVAVGMGTAVLPLTTAGISGVAREEAGIASGLINVARQVGGALGLAILATLAASRTSHVLHGVSASASSLAERVALADGYVRAFELSAAFSVVGVVVVALMLRPQSRGREPVAQPAAAPVES